MTRILVSVLILLSAAFAAAQPSALSIDDAFVPAPPPLSSMGAAYFRVTNQSTSRKTITSAEGPCAQSYSIHRTVVEDEIARMRPVGSLTITPGETLRFEPGGIHIMLTRPALETGNCDFDLKLSDGSRVRVSAKVISIREATRRATGDDTGSPSSGDQQ